MEEKEVQQSTMKLKDYTVRIIPKLTKKSGEDGDEIVTKYLRRTNPSEKARKDGKVKPTSFFHLEVFEKGKKKLGGDTKPHTIIIFENTDPILFENIAELDGDDTCYRIIEASKNKPKILTEELPGLLRKKKCAPYYATRVNSDGRVVKLTVNKKQPDGNFGEDTVILTSVRYFLHENDVNTDADEIAYVTAVDNTSAWLVKGMDSGAPEVEEAKGENLDNDDEPEEDVVE